VPGTESLQAPKASRPRKPLKELLR
jgi:hypothetical protein